MPNRKYENEYDRISNILNDYCYKNDVKGLVNRLITQNRQMVKALYDSRNEFLKAERYNRLKQIEGKIDSALIANTIESIQDQFEQFN